jgi:hypothetical protein
MGTRTKTYIITFVALMLVTVVKAQEISTNDVDARADRNRIITTSKKLASKPQPIDTTISMPDVVYYIEPAKYDLAFDAQPIKAARLKVIEPLDKLYPGYVKFGVGNYLMPYFDAYYGSERNRGNSWGVNAKHHSASGLINDVGNPSFSNTEFNGFYNKFYDRATWSTKLYYDRDVVHRYGFDAADSLIPQFYRENKDSTKLGVNQIGFKTQFRSRHRDSSKLHHREALQYYFLNNTAGLVENNLIVNTTLSKYLEEENIEANVDFEIDFNSVKQPALRPIDTTGALINGLDEVSNSGIVRLVPYVVSSRILNKLHFKGGFGVNIDMADINRFYFYPEVELSYNLYNNIFVPYAGATGGVQRNSYDNIRRENPWTLSNAYLRNTNEKINAYAGIRGAISSEWSFNLTARLQNLENKALFYNDTAFSYQNGFGIIYDTIKQTTLSGQLSYQKGEKLFIFGKGEYFKYKTQNQEHAWLQPDFKFSLNARYDLANKIVAKLNVYVIGNRKTFSYDSIADVSINDASQYLIELKPYVDANLGLEYRYNKRLSVFLDLNNLTAAKYQQWTKYPVHRFNVLGGFTFRF